MSITQWVLAKLLGDAAEKLRTRLAQKQRPAQSAASNPDGFTCPRCGRTSGHPMDKQEGYCGACHDWTGPRTDPRQ